MPVTDKENRIQLVEAARRGDLQAVSRLLTVCQPDLKRFARRTCGSSEDIEDAVQTAMWQIYAKIGALRAASTFATWIFRIVERECYRLFRLRSRWDSVDEKAVETLASPAVPLDLRLDLSRSIAALPPAYRDVLLLRDVEEMTAPEVAAQLGLSLGAVKSRLRHARSVVRRYLVSSGYRISGLSSVDKENSHGL